MIFDAFSRIQTYRSLSPHLARAIDFLTSADLDALSLGRHEIDGERVYAMLLEYQTSPEGRAVWESHRKYIDLQLILRGREKILVADTAALKGAGAYDAAKDVIFYDGGEPTAPAELRERQFVILFPHDGHRATFSFGEPCLMRKVVVKIAAG